MAPRSARADTPYDATRSVRRHVVVDGSNIATEGRDTPSLAQLDEAVRAYMREYAPEIVTVVVDATFPNRIARSERDVYEAAAVAGEIITPPAGAIGRGDAFILQIAERAEATILSNDSFQEFHGVYDWLFEPGRLVGGKPVPHVGWVFMDRTPVRGPLSRRSVSAAKRASDGGAAPAPVKAGRAAKTAKKAAAGTPVEPVGAAEPPATKAAKSGRAAKAAKAKAGPAAEPSAAPAAAPGEPVEPKGRRSARSGAASGPDGTPDAAASGSGRGRSRKAATGEAAVDPSAPGSSGRGKGGKAPKEAPGGAGPDRGEAAKAVTSAAPANEALPFIEFVGAHPVGSRLTGVVEQFSSHGAYVRVGSVQAYVPLKYLAVPAPRSAKQVLRLGESRAFVVVSVDGTRRGIDLALPGVDLPAADAPAPAAKVADPPEKAPARKKATAAPKATARKQAAKKAGAPKANATKQAANKQAPKKAGAKKAVAKKAAAQRTSASRRSVG